MEASLGRKGDYSVRAMLNVAINQDSRQKAREIADAMVDFAMDGLR